MLANHRSRWLAFFVPGTHKYNTIQNSVGFVCVPGTVSRGGNLIEKIINCTNSID